MADLDQYRERSRENWRRMAGGWERRSEWMGRMTAPVYDWIVDAADPRPGQTFLEVAAGTGELSERIAARVAPHGRVICTDFSPEMTEVAMRLGEAPNVEHRVMDAERMDLGDDSADGVVSRFGYMLMADPAAALGHTRRVLRDGGPLALAVWQGADRNPWAAIPARTLAELGHVPPPEPGAPGIFALADPARIGELLNGAGFRDPVVEEVALEYRYEDDDELWEVLTALSGAFAQALEQLPEEEREGARAAVIERMASFRGADGSYSVPGATWGVIAR